MYSLSAKRWKFTFEAFGRNGKLPWFLDMNILFHASLSRCILS